MAMSGTASNHSPRHSPDNVDSPQSRRAVRPVVSSPWNQVVRGESEPTAAAPLSPSPPATLVESSPVVPPSLPMDDSSSVGESLDNGSVPNGNTGKRPAWNKPSNGADSEAKPVMGAVSWPALSESTRATMKSSTESPKGGVDGSSVSQLQGAGITPSSSIRQVSDNANPNNVVPTRQKSIKRNGPNASFNGGHQQQSAPQGQITATGFHNTSPKDHTQRSGYVSQNHNVHDHPQQRNSFRNRNGGPHQRGDGTHHHNYGSRREQDRGNQDWNTYRNFNGRDSHMSPRVFPRFMRPPPPPPPPTSGQFIPPPPVRPFGGPVGFPVVYVAAPPPDSIRGVPFAPPLPPHAMFFSAPDLQLPAKIVNQIDYYFSGENLIKDTYLRLNMDEQGWVPIKLIAGFKKVMQLTDNVQLILDALRTSSVVEVQGDKIRRKFDWKRWIMPTSVPPDVMGSQSPGKVSHDMLLAVRNISLDHKTSNDAVGQLDIPSDASQNKSSFGDLNNQLQLSTAEGTNEVGIQGSDHSIYARN
ncbi:la-related protein 1C isoform X2 [Neltuma alba]|uniref:la-related protein 1C isoform X2 n=1 Tax=Neltuma alba TaxID=207710 RepID=UPI0010A3B710|nr:la-related protein 1C isoform X2 [Prosopis alba]